MGPLFARLKRRARDSDHLCPCIYWG